MTKVIRKVGNHYIEANFSWWTGNATIKLDNMQIFSKMVFTSHKEDVDVDGRIFRVRFGGLIVPNIEIEEIVKT